MTHVLRVVVVVFAAILSTRQITDAQSAPSQNAPAHTPTQSPAQAQVSATDAPRAIVADRLPVRRVILYKSGVGYFEHLGRVSGNQTVTVEFTSGQLDDVLKSLTALDLDGGRISGVSYNSDDALNRRLESLRLPVGQQTTRAQFLSALRGAKLDVGAGATRVIGRLLSVEKVTRQTGGATTQVDAVSIVTDAGDVQTIALDPGVNVRIVEADLNQEVGKYLALVASVRDQDVRRLAISSTGTGARDLFVSYVSEVPVWKATYRLVLPSATDTRKPLLQGWAIVDNTVGQDWENVELSLVAGAPQSFIQQISRPYYVQRPVVPLPQRVLFAPQTHQGAMGVTGPGSITGTVTDSDGGFVPGVTVRVTNSIGVASTAATNTSGRYQVLNLAPGIYDVATTMTGFKRDTRTGIGVSAGMETVLNTRLQLGAMTDEVTVRGGTERPRGSTINGLPQQTLNMSVDGVTTSNALNATDGFFAKAMPRSDAVEAVMLQQGADANGGQLGDLFEYKLTAPVTIRKNQSALVPIVAGSVDVEKVSIWNMAGQSVRPLRAVWLTNTTGNTLDGGSFTVVEGQAFAGEGLIEPMKPGERRLLSYAVDLGVQVTGLGEEKPTRLTKIEVHDGLIVQKTEARRERNYVVRNDDTEARAVILEHPVRAGWKATSSIEPAETTAASYRYRVSVTPKASVTFAVTETSPIETQISVDSLTEPVLAFYVSGKVVSPALEAQFRMMLTRRAAIEKIEADISAREHEVETIEKDQSRLRENMKSLKGTSEEKALLQRYVKQLDDQETRLEVVRKELTSLASERDKAQEALDKFIEEIKG